MNSEFIPQQSAYNLLKAAKEAVILLREEKSRSGWTFGGDPQLTALVDAILEAEGN